MTTTVTTKEWTLFTFRQRVSILFLIWGNLRFIESLVELTDSSFNHHTQLKLVRRTDGFTTVELTAENFWDYFEIRKSQKSDLNGFDEVAKVRESVCVSLKEEYTNPFLDPDLNCITVEILVDIGDVSFKYDSSSESFVIDEKTFKARHSDNPQELTLGKSIGSDKYDLYLYTLVCDGDQMDIEQTENFYRRNVRFSRASAALVIPENPSH